MALYQVVDEDTFLKKFGERSRESKELIPLLGGGISAASGIPLVPGIQEYLSCCIYMALRGGRDSGNYVPWTPREQWPDLNFF